jgi:hypothetical protein
MEPVPFHIDRFSLNGENSNAFLDFEEPFDDEEEDEDDNVRGLTELVKERCQKCLSSFLDPYTTKEGMNVICCKGCQSLLCPKCLGLLEPYVTSSGQKTLQCQKCKTIL